jgi:hypothetical protein
MYIYRNNIVLLSRRAFLTIRPMPKIISLYLLIFSFLTSLAQNDTYTVYERTINNEAVSYFEAKKAWLSVKNAREKFDPVCTLHLLGESLEHGDTIFFKEELSYLIEARGFELNERFIYEDYYDDLTSGGLKEWYSSTFSEKNALWRSNNPLGAEVQTYIQHLFAIEQILLRAEVAMTNDELTPTEREYIRGYFQTEYEQQVYLPFISLCKEINQVPNNFSYGMMMSEISRLIIEHALENDANEFKRKWSEIFPIWEKGFFEGFFDTSLLHTYDATSEIFTGKQYYGTLANIPCEDEEGLDERRVRFGLKG